MELTTTQRQREGGRDGKRGERDGEESEERGWKGEREREGETPSGMYNIIYYNIM